MAWLAGETAKLNQSRGAIAMCNEQDQRNEMGSTHASAAKSERVGYAMDTSKGEQYRAGLRDEIEGAELTLREMRHRRDGVDLEIAQQERYIKSLRNRLESAR
jgi:hypothetical protein